MPMSIRQSSLIVRCTPLLGALLLSACATQQSGPEPAAAATDGVQTVQERRILGFLTPYRPDVQQGNFISQEMVDQLRIGMTPAQVRFVLGTPLLTDVFHADRWDYPFRLKKGSGEIISSRVTVYFENDRLARIEGGNLPAEEKFLDLLTGSTDNN
jgi:outer membrane protein assembly factor BamE